MKSAVNLDFRITALVALAVMVVAIAVFLPSVRGGFVNLDDPQYVHHNPIVTGGLTWTGVQAAFRVFNHEYWLPVLFLSYMVDAELFGTSAWGFHLVNVILHAVNAVLVFLLLKGGTGKLWPSLAACLLFAIHPLRVESVAWVAQRKDVLSATFMLLALAAWGRYTSADESRSRFSWYGLSALLLLLGLMTKPILVTFPVLLLILDIWPLERCPWPFPDPSGWLKKHRRLIWEKVPFILLGIGFSVATIVNQRTNLGVASDGHAVLDPLLRAPISYFLYLGKTVWPAGLGMEFRHPDPAIPLVQGLSATVVHVSILWFLWRLREKRPYLLAGWLWYLVALLPISGIVPVGLQWLSDRFTYLPLLGIVTAACWLSAELLEQRMKPATLAVICASLLSLLAVATIRQIGFWADSRTLFQRSVTLDPASTRAYFVFGSALAREGKLGEALVAMEEGARLSPYDPVVLKGLADVLTNMGLVSEAVSRLEEAAVRKPYSMALQRDLSWLKGVQGDWEGRAVNLASLLELVRTKREKAIVGSELAKTLWNLGRRPEALEHLRRAAAMQPESTQYHFDLGLALLRMGKTEEAAARFAELGRVGRDQALSELGMAESLIASGRREEALAHLESLSGKGDGPEAIFAKGRIAQLGGRMDEAMEFYRRALEAKPSPDLRRLMRIGMGEVQATEPAAE